MLVANVHFRAIAFAPATFTPGRYNCDVLTKTQQQTRGTCRMDGSGAGPVDFKFCYAGNIQIPPCAIHFVQFVFDSDKITAPDLRKVRKMADDHSSSDDFLDATRAKPGRKKHSAPRRQ